MNRRGFLGALAAALVLDPERALWVPGKKVISVPAPGKWVTIRLPMRAYFEDPGPFVIQWVEMSQEEFRKRYPDGPSRPALTRPID